MSIVFSEPGLFLGKEVCSSGSETANPPTLATDGMSLTTYRGVTGIAVTVAAHDGVTNLTAASTLLAYLYNVAFGSWARANDLDLTVAGGAVSQGFPGVAVSPSGRIAYVPSGLGTAVDIYLAGTTSL